MQAFNGPFAKNLSELKALLDKMPERYKTSFTNASKGVLQTLCDPENLHVWESDSDLDNLLQLTSVIARSCRLRGDTDEEAPSHNGMLVIVAEESPGRDNFARICELVKHLKGKPGNKSLGGTVLLFSDVVVVKGWNNAMRGGDHAERVSERINITLERVLKKRRYLGRKENIVWHHGPVLHQFLLWINKTTPGLRAALIAATITGSLALNVGVTPSSRGYMNRVSELEQLYSYASRLAIPIAFLDSSSLLVEHEYLGTYVYFYAYYINMLLPAAVLRPHHNRALDELVTFCFRLGAVAANKFGSDAVGMVRRCLTASVNEPWLRNCMKVTTFERSKCRKAARDREIHHAVQLAEAPYISFSSGSQATAFARLSVGPAASCTTHYHIAAPVDIQFKSAQFRLALPAQFYIVLPISSQSAGSITNRLQGLMMAVITRVQQKGNLAVEIGNAERETWKVVSAACLGALNGRGRVLPDGTDEKTKFVRERIKFGTWATAVSTPRTLNNVLSSEKDMRDFFGE